MTTPPPTPQRLASWIAQIKTSLDEIEREYRWWHNATYNSGGGSGFEPGHTSPHESDATGQAGVAAVKTSGRLRLWAKTIRRLGVVSQTVAREMRARPETVERPDEFPMTVTPDQLQDLREAQSRRAARGEGWGTG